MARRGWGGDGDGDMAPRPGRREEEVCREFYLLATKVVVSEAELKLAKCRHAESWPTFCVICLLCSTEFLYLVGGVRPAPAKRCRLGR